MEDQGSLPQGLKLGFIGVGKMATAIIKGVSSSGILKPENIMGSAVQPTSIEKIKNLGIQATTNNSEVVAFSDVVILAVKPHIIPKVLQDVKSGVNEHKLIISVAAGVTLETLEKSLPPNCRLVRVMPNLPASIGCGTSAVCMGSSTASEDSEILTKIFKTCGYVEFIPENYIDIITATTVPTFACVAVEAMADGAVKMGLPRDLALRLAAQSLMCGAKLIHDTGKHPAVIKDEVCSPGGTTIAGVHCLEAGGMRGTIITAIEAATNRARQLGQAHTK